MQAVKGRFRPVAGRVFLKLDGRKLHVLDMHLVSGSFHDKNMILMLSIEETP